jgi:hypothetical protein
MFMKAVAEAAYLADARQYALLRPMLLELKRECPELATGDSRCSIGGGTEHHVPSSLRGERDVGLSDDKGSGTVS